MICGFLLLTDGESLRTHLKSLMMKGDILGRDMVVISMFSNQMDASTKKKKKNAVIQISINKLYFQ